MKYRVNQIIGSWFGLGYLPIAPGTAGSLGAFLLILPAWDISIPVQMFLVLALMLGGVWISKELVAVDKEHDPSHIVIDEVVGQWFTVLLSRVFLPSEIGMEVLCVTAFLGFRVFDIFKPQPIRWVDKNQKNAWGVMADDVAAGLMATPLVVLVASVWMWWTEFET